MGEMSDVWIMLKTWQQLERLNACENEGKMKAKDHVVNVRGMAARRITLEYAEARPLIM